jgi:glucosamine--fructose-6-phosphate aminotransferase (isomerizing)
METRAYLHGPLEAVEEGFGCVVFGREREQQLATQLASFGASVMLVADQDVQSGPNVQAIQIPEVPALLAPILQILPVQLLIDHVARQRGLEAGKLRRQQADTKVA